MASDPSHPRGSMVRSVWERKSKELFENESSMKVVRFFLFLSTEDEECEGERSRVYVPCRWVEEKVARRWGLRHDDQRATDRRILEEVETEREDGAKTKHQHERKEDIEEYALMGSERSEEE
jgi:hypothetical protein